MPVTHKCRSVKKVSKSRKAGSNFKRSSKTRKNVNKLSGAGKVRFGLFRKKKESRSGDYSLTKDHDNLANMEQQMNIKRKKNGDERWNLLGKQKLINDKRTEIEEWKENKIADLTSQATILNIQPIVGYFDIFLTQKNSSTAKKCIKPDSDDAYNLTADIYKKDENGKYIKDPCKFFQWVETYVNEDEYGRTYLIKYYYAVNDINICDFVTDKQAETKFYKDDQAKRNFENNQKRRTQIMGHHASYEN